MASYWRKGANHVSDFELLMIVLTVITIVVMLLVSNKD